MGEKRKVLFTNGMSNDFMLIITDAPKERIEAWCYRYNKALDDGTYGRGKEVQLFDILKTQYYVKELLDSEIDNREDLELIGWVEEYELSSYYTDEKLDNVSFLKRAIYELLGLLWVEFDCSSSVPSTKDRDAFFEYICEETRLTKNLLEELCCEEE